MSPVLDSAIDTFRKMKRLAEGAISQLSDDDLHWSPDGETNSVAVVIQHLHGNMLSRWTDFLTADGEKDWRDRDGEFVAGTRRTKAELLALWEAGWQAVFAALEPLSDADLSRPILIRKETLSVMEAVNRQISHYAYHVGQIVLMAKMRRARAWKTLSIARGKSREYAPPPR